MESESDPTEDPYEHDEESYNEHVRYLYEQISNSPQLTNNDNELQNVNSMNHNQNNFSNSGFHEQIFNSVNQYQMDGSDIVNQTQINDYTDTSQLESYDSDHDDHNFNSDNETTDNNLKDHFQNQDAISNIPSISFTSPNTTNISVNPSEQYNQTIHFRSNAVNIDIESVIPFRNDQNSPNQSYFNIGNGQSLINFNTMYLPNLSLHPRFGWECKRKSAFSGCQKLDSDEFDRYIRHMVLLDQPKLKVTKRLKLIIFNFFQGYLINTHPELQDKILRPLSRNEQRNVQDLSKRLLMMKDHVYYNFEHNKKETLIPVAEAYYEDLLKNKKKFKDLAQNILKIINDTK